MLTLRVFAIVTGVVLGVAILAAQQTGTGTSTTGGGGAGSTTGAGNTTNTGGNSNTGGSNSSRTNSATPFPTEIPRPIFLSGRVVLSDGTALSESVVIERVCAGIPHSEAHTDSKGRFSFQLGQSQEVFMDLSEPTSFGSKGITSAGPSTGGIRGTELTNCELRASLPGYRSDVVSLFNHRSMDSPDVGTIVLHSLANVEGLTVSAVSARAPKDARKAYEKGLDAAKKNKTDEARKDFEKAIELYPKYAVAWLELGKVHEQEKQVEEARAAYAQALAADSKYASPYERLYMMAFREAKWQELADTTDRVLHLNPYDFPNAYYYNGVANLELNQLDVAEKRAREAVKLDTMGRNVKTNYVLGIILARKRAFVESSEYLRAYLKAAPNAPDVETVRKQLVQVETFAQASTQPVQ